MTDYKQLCAELLAALEEEASNWNLDPECHPLVVRARAALAEPEPKGPTDEELKQWQRDCASKTTLGDATHYWALGVPTDLANDLVRAALARWGNHPGSPDSLAQLDTGELDHRFEVWWYNEGSGRRPCANEDQEEFVHRATRIAWHNGAYCALWGNRQGILDSSTPQPS
jgi:hypothetical protein